MCGVMGYSGFRPVATVVLAGLEQLQSRGYDSAGLSGYAGDKLVAVKATGPVASLRDALAAAGPSARFTGRAGIGHTRWATHGEVSPRNAHPFLGCSADFAVAVNGICENFAELRAGLEARGHAIESDTDSEIVVHLLEEASGDVAQALRQVAGRLRGSFAIVAVAAAEPGVVAATRRHVPLVLAVADRQAAVCSATDAAPWADDFVSLDDDDVVRIADGRAQVRDRCGVVVDRPHFAVVQEHTDPLAGGFTTRLESEIAEQARAVAATLARFVGTPSAGAAPPAEDRLALGDGVDALLAAPVRRLVIVGCGTAHNAAQAARAMFREWAGRDVVIAIASEWDPSAPAVRADDLVIAVSQSGETADTLVAARQARRLGARTLAVTNARSSQLARECDAAVLTRAGVELSVAATKTYACQVVALGVLALALGRASGRTTPVQRRDATAALLDLPARLEEVLGGATRAAVGALAATFAAAPYCVFLGRRDSLPIAAEAALKMRELAYTPVEVHPVAELKHGPFALLAPGIPVVVISDAGDASSARLATSVHEIRARGSFVVGVVSGTAAALETVCDAVLRVPATDPTLQPLLSLVPLQLLAHDVAVHRGHDVDRPRNLAKTVTVE